MFSIGWSTEVSAKLVAEDLYQGAASRLVGKPQWGLLFASGFHDGQQLFDALREQAGTELPLFGGSCCGIICPAGIHYGGYEALLLLFSDPAPDFLSLDQGAFEAEPVRRWLGDDHALLFFDLLGHNLATAMDELDGCHLSGAAMLGDHRLSSSFVFDGNGCVNDQVVLVKVPAPKRQRISHGSDSVSQPLTITAVRDNCILTLDHRPALEQLREFTGLALASRDNPLALQLSLGRRHDGEQLTSHLVAALDDASGGLVMAMGHFQKGEQVEVMLRSGPSIFADMDRALGQLEPDRPSLYIDCAGRTSSFSGLAREEAQLLRERLQLRTAGFFSGAELATLAGRPTLMNWTGVMLQW
ncbi:FIST N-terminal domain-containing protein [Gallaecimonas sp. GXIMD4217]|uniref:FIST N-terminal domain-containing protein n=1 Tax=Gallaecimonas sp. GXIMD4217 TaxID=3131927 RepID=UPI00311AD9FA